MPLANASAASATGVRCGGMPPTARMRGLMKGRRVSCGMVTRRMVYFGDVRFGDASATFRLTVLTARDLGATAFGRGG